MNNEKADYIIAGAGCAGLSLAVHMIRSGRFHDKKVILIDKEPKSKNDRTWCFWETEAGMFEPLVCRNWDKVWFHSSSLSRLMTLHPYKYKMIRSADFYKYCLDLIYRQSNFEIQFKEVQAINSEHGSAWVESNGEKISARYVFSSIELGRPPLKKNEYLLLQHFKGWIIQTTSPVFASKEATLMDFRVSQKHGTTFTYVLPISDKKALVEYTLFTENLLEPTQYDAGLHSYIRDYLSISHYTIEEEEFGVIPMTNRKFPRQHGNIIYVGTAGGQTKASSGYTFQFIQKHSAAIVDQLLSTGEPMVRNSSHRFHFYDSVLLDILHHGKVPGDKIFTRLFKKNATRKVLRFLDNESSLTEEVKIISTLPALPFLRAAARHLK